MQGKSRIWSFVLAVALPCITAGAEIPIPPGSYQQTCKNIKVDAKLSLRADCDAKDKGKFWEGTQPLENYFYCVGDIYNDDGHLRCKKELNSAPMVAARKAITAGAAEALGRPIEKHEYVTWIRTMFNGGMAASFFKGWTPLEARIFFNLHVAQPENGDLRAKIINSAFRAVYGMDSSAERQAYWDAKLREGGDAYSRVVADETKRLNENVVTKKLTVLRVYKDTMGRPPTAAETSYWTPRSEHYQAMVDAARNWLYSPQGAVDLAATTRRALEDKYAKKSVTDADVKEAMKQYAKSRKIFDEM